MNAKPEHIDVLLGKIRERAELIVKANTDGTNLKTAWDRSLYHSEAIVALIENWQADALISSLEGSIAAITSLPDSVVSMSPQEIAEVVRKADVTAMTTAPDFLAYVHDVQSIADVIKRADSNIRQIKTGVIEIQEEK